MRDVDHGRVGNDLVGQIMELEIGPAGKRPVALHIAAMVEETRRPNREDFVRFDDDEIVIQIGPDTGHGVPIHFGVTDGRYKLIRFPDDKLNTWEFFDLKTDPQEMKSRYTDSKYAGTIAGLKKELTRLRKHYQVKD